MNRNDIYRKTPAGEEAIIHRVKAEERKLRVVLVLVDGKTSVGEISEKVGDDALTQAAIATLEAGGFVALMEAADNSPLPPAPSDARAPLDPVRQESQIKPEAEVSQTAPTDFAPPQLRPAGKVRLMSIENFALPPISDAQQHMPANTLPASRMVDINVKPELTEEEKENRRKLRVRQLRRVCSVFGGALLLVSTGIAGIFLYPYGAERQALEKWLSQGLGVPVRVGQVSPVLSPKPMLELRQIQIGNVPGQNRIELIRLPGLFSRLFGLSFNADDQVDISGGSLDAVLLSAWRDSTAPWGMAKVHFQQMEIHLGEYTLATFDGDTLFAQNGGLQRANLYSKPLQLQLEITAQDKAAYTVMGTSVNGWQPVPDSPFRIRTLSGVMQLHPDHLRLEKGDMHLLGGNYKGDLELSWRDGKVHKMNGKGILSDIRITDLLNDTGFTKPAAATNAALKLEGDISGALSFHTSGETPALWRKNLEAHGQIKAKRSVLRGISLIRLMRGGSRGKITQRGGMTQFSELDFTVDMNSDGLKLGKLQLRATSLHGEGDVNIDAEGELTGKIRLMMFGGDGGHSELLLDGRYPLLNAELRDAP